MKAAVKELLKEFQKSYTKYDSVNRWKNKLSGGKYQNYCLESLALFCVKFNMTPDQVIQTRIEEQKSSDPLTRAKAEDRLLGFHKEIVTKSPGLAICRFRHMKSFYSANYVALQCTDPGYTIQREQDYLPTTYISSMLSQLSKTM